MTKNAPVTDCKQKHHQVFQVESPGFELGHRSCWPALCTKVLLYFVFDKVLVHMHQL